MIHGTSLIFGIIVIGVVRKFWKLKTVDTVLLLILIVWVAFGFSNGLPTKPAPKNETSKPTIEVKQAPETTARKPTEPEVDSYQVKNAIDDLYNLRESVKRACEEEVRERAKGYKYDFSTTNSKWDITKDGLWNNRNSFWFSLGESVSDKSAYNCFVDASNAKNGKFIVTELIVGPRQEFW